MQVQIVEKILKPQFSSKIVLKLYKEGDNEGFSHENQQATANSDDQLTSGLSKSVVIGSGVNQSRSIQRHHVYLREYAKKYSCSVKGTACFVDAKKGVG
ncbi:hypothetical protein Q1695_009053 [Nippostrongylus brasiliensis]|nr:hypothetical protein Q1695_009053 [Nippostrongylus brasiliensis]